MTRLRALACFAAFLAVASTAPRALTDAGVVISTIFGIGCGLLAAALVATAVVALGDRRSTPRAAPVVPWWREQSNGSEEAA